MQQRKQSGSQIRRQDRYDITKVTSKVMNVNIRRINLGTEDGIFDGFIDLYVHDIDDLENLILKLKNIKGIESVIRKEL